MFTRSRKYYSTRTGKNPNTRMSLDDLKDLFLLMYASFEEKGYFQEYFGYYCVDNGDVPGTLGSDIASVIRFILRKVDLWPVRNHIGSYSEDDLFDVIEFLHDHISFPLDGYYHQFDNCGYHYDSFNQDQGRREFIVQLNKILEEYGEGYELTVDGEILSLAPPGMDIILRADVPSDDRSITDRINAAVNNFRRYKSTFDERRHAIRHLADVLEYLRPHIKSVITKKDESDLFNIVNNFGVRHHNKDQKTNYEKAVWYS